MNVQEHKGNDKSCVWHATDFAVGELKDEFFCIRFVSLERTGGIVMYKGRMKACYILGMLVDAVKQFKDCKTFEETVQEVAETQGKKVENEDAFETAGLLEKLSVGDAKTKVKEKKEEPAKEKSNVVDGVKKKTRGKGKKEGL